MASKKKTAPVKGVTDTTSGVCDGCGEATLVATRRKLTICMDCAQWAMDELLKEAGHGL